MIFSQEYTYLIENIFSNKQLTKAQDIFVLVFPPAVICLKIQCSWEFIVLEIKIKLLKLH